MPIPLLGQVDQEGKNMFRSFLLATFAVLVIVSANAQLATTTALVGTVTDSSGQTVPNAKVTAVNRDTADTYNATTNDQGYYNIQFVRVGTYNLLIEKSGFQKLEKTGVQVDINQIVRTDVTLAIGTISQSVTVEATVTAIKTDDATVSEVLGTRAVSDLPLNGRDPMSLAVTTPGVLQGPKSSLTGTPPGEDFIGAGTREIQNSLSLDGISIMNNLITTTPTRPMIEAIQEVEVQTGTYSAQYGAYLGVHLNMITKAGTNQLHGSLVEFLRNDVLDARPYFLNPTSKKTVLRQNQYGFELDGPIVIPKLYNGRDKTFFMGSYEGLRTRNQSVSIANLLTPAMFNGDFSSLLPGTIIKDPLNGNTAFPGNIIPANRISPVVLKLQSLYATPNLPGNATNLSTSVGNQFDTDQTVDRLDQNIGSKIRLFFRYQRQDQNIVSGNVIPVNGNTSPIYTNNMTLGYTHTLTTNIVNDFRIGRQYFDTKTLNPTYLSGTNGLGASLGIP